MNKETAVNFLRAASAGRIDEAYEKYTDESFKHHNAYFRGDRLSLMNGMKENALRFPEKVCTVKKILEDGPQVMTYSHIQMKPGEPGVAVVHIFRFHNGRIAELWDVGQPIPKDTPNENGLF